MTRRMSAVAIVGGLLAFAQRVALASLRPWSLNDLDAGETKHMLLALHGLPPGEGWAERLSTWLSGPEHLHHGGFVVDSVLFAALSAVFGPSLGLLRVLPAIAWGLTTALTAAWVGRRGGPRPQALTVAMFLGMPPLLLKWTTVAWGGHVEAAMFVPMLLLLAESARATGQVRRWLLAGAVAGVAAWFSYVTWAVSGVVLAAALWRSGWRALAATVGGAVLGFAPWWLGWLVLDLPYFSSSIHAAPLIDEAGQVRGRGLWDTGLGLLRGLPHNLLPWSVVRGLGEPYGSDRPDLLLFEPGPLTWCSRALVGGLVIAAAAAARRWGPLALAVAAAPALHHLFVLRLANTAGWPDVPHRYLLVSWPCVVAAVALAASRWRLTTAAVALLAVAQGVAVAPWFLRPDPGRGDWAPIVYVRASIGRVRPVDAAAVAAALARMPRVGDNVRVGFGAVWPLIAERNLLFLPPPPPPEPQSPSTIGMPSDRPDAVREVLFGYLLGLTALDGDVHRFCGWQPPEEWADEAQEALRLLGPPGACPGG